MTTPPARGGHAVAPPGAPPGSPRPATKTYAALPWSAKVMINSIPPGHAANMILDENAPVLADGGGGWVVTDRWGRKGLTSWQGVKPMTLSFTALFDAEATGQPDIEADVNDLEWMWQPRGDFNAPRHVRVSGAMPQAALNRDWLINSLVWQPAATLRRASGERRRAVADIGLLEFVDPDSVIRPTKRAASAAVRKRIYHVKPGDTLESIARSQLGDARLADDIRRENLPALKDARSISKLKTILLPAGKSNRS